MNKLTKLLSVFVIAGAIGTGIAGVAGCKKGNDNGNKHQHHYTWVADADGNKCHEECDAAGECDAKVKPSQDHVDTKNNETGATGADGKCDNCGTAVEAPPTQHVHNYDWQPNDDETHSGTCSVEGCDKPNVINEAHEWGADHRCVKCRTKQPSYTVTFNVHGEGTAPAAQEAYKGDMITVPEAPTSETKYFGGWYENADYTGGKFDFSKPASKTVELHARWLNKINISTAEELETFRTTATAEDGSGGLASGAYVLTADIDLEGRTLGVAASVIGDGIVFDGNGHVIKNASYNGTESKIGLLCKTVNGGEVTNVKFLNCAISSTSESIGIIAGECNSSSSISKIEFNSCSSVTTNNYAGLIFGRREGSDAIVIGISEITVKNGSYTSCAQYGGLLIGDITATTTVNFKNLHIDGEFKDSSGNCSFIAGRTRDGATVTVENAVISATMPTANSAGIFAGGGAAKLNLKNILILKSNNANIGATNKSHTVTKENIVTVAGVTVTEATGTDGQNTVAYLTGTLGFDFTNVWTEEGTDGYRLKAASTNVKSADAKLATLKVSAGNAKVRFKQGEEFSSEGLTVMGAYDDGVQLVLTEGVEYEVVSTDFDKTTAGKYTITVRAIEAGATAEDVTYEVTVVAETGFEINHEFIPHVYLRGDKLDTSNLVVYSVWTDGVKEKVAAKDIKIVPQSYNMTAAGKYEVLVAYKSYAAQEVTISVVNTKVVPVDGKLYINVDPAAVASSYSGAQVNGVETFANVADAIDYLEACNFDKSVQKVIRIAAGTYKAKITTDLENLTLIGLGATADDVRITYDAVESTVNPLTGAGYAMNCATFHVNGAGFKAYNVFFDNSFDYINESKNESSPQGFALTINGDGAVIENCHLYGNQDTLFLRNGRSYFKNTQIDGNVDFIFGENTGLAYFDHCTIMAVSRFAESTSNKSNNGYVTAMKGDPAKKPSYGYIFDSCEFTHGEGVVAGSMSLGRPWGKAATVAMINCSFSNAYSTGAYGAVNKSRWADMSGNSPVDADFCEYGSTGDGAITEAVNGGKVLTETQAANYTAANLFAATNGGVTWSAAWSHTDALALLQTLKGELVTEPGDLYVSAEEVTVAEDGDVDLLISYTPWNLADKGITITVADESIASYSCGVVHGILEGTTKIVVEYGAGLTKEIPVTVTAKDPTIREYIKYTYTNGAEIVSPDRKVTFTDLAKNGDWIKFGSDNGGISFTAVKGTVVTLNVYSGTTGLLVNDGTEREVLAENGVVTFTVANDGAVTIKRKAGDGNTYFKAFEINVPITESKTIDLLQYDGQASGKSVWNGIEIDVTTGKFAKRETDIQVNVGTVLKMLVVEGTTVKVVAYNDKDDAANWDIVIENGVATLTAKANTYIKALEVTCPKTEFSYLYGSEANGAEWTTNSTVSNSPKLEDGTNDTAPEHVSLQLSDGDFYLDLAAKGTKVTINSVVGYTIGTNNASEWLVIELLDENDGVVGEVKGTTTAKKAIGEYTFANKVIEASAQFVKIRFKCVSNQASAKSISINSVNIKVD